MEQKMEIIIMGYIGTTNHQRDTFGHSQRTKGQSWVCEVFEGNGEVHVGTIKLCRIAQGS